MLNFVMNEMVAVAPFPVYDQMNGQIRLKLKSECGESKWLNVTPEQFHMIERVLLGEFTSENV